MRKITFLAFLAFSTASLQAQENKFKKEINHSDLNKLTIEINSGQAKGITPYTQGYYIHHGNNTFVTNSYNFAGRYMLSPIFGVKLDFGFFKLNNNPEGPSLPFELNAFTVGLQGVVNTSKLFKIEKEMGRFDILLHSGIQISKLQSQFFPKKDNNLGLTIGFSPQFRLSNRISLISDFTLLRNFKQFYTWDGRLLDRSLNQSAILTYTTLGLTYSIGKNKMHGDWAEVKDTNLVAVDALQNRINELEIQLKDSDKDGVSDYLDQENNTILGATVDSKGKAILVNKDGIPIEFEKYVELKTKENNKTSNSILAQSFINDGYISINFDSGKTILRTDSSKEINFIKTFLINNPTQSIVIIGHADTNESNSKNTTLSNSRAEVVKSTLIKSGVDSSKLIIASEKDASEESKKTIKRVTFKIK